MIRIILPVIISILCFFLIVPTDVLSKYSLETLTDVDHNYALFIGISDYAHWPDLVSPSKDVEMISDLLLSKYNFKKDNVLILTDQRKKGPSKKNIISLFQKYVKELNEKDNLLIYFSGHCFEDANGETYWIPEDGKKDDKTSWLSHSTLTNDYFSSVRFKVKHLFSVRPKTKIFLKFSVIDLKKNAKIFFINANNDCT